MRVLHQRETFDPFYREALPLIVQHKDEIAHYPDIALNVDVDAYRDSEQCGRLRVYTARLDRGRSEPLKLIGYAVFFVSTHFHYRDITVAQEDVFYVDPEQRHARVGMELIRFSEAQLRREGVQAVYRHVKDAHPGLGVLLERSGYELIDRIYGKRLDK